MKPYVKPELYYESFELAQHIAGCSLQINSTDLLACVASGTISSGPWETVSSSWFLEQNKSCEDWAEAYCYTNGSITSATINS